MRIGAGAMLAGRYRLTTPLGSGGMGEVWRAEHALLRSAVAVKLIDGPSIGTPESSARFLREARAAASLQHPHIVRVFDYGVDDGVAFMVMELLDGESLGARLARATRLAMDETERLITQVARGLAAAHDGGIVHRDLKPDNIFLAGRGEDEVAKVLDFGVAKLVGGDLSADAADSAHTRTGVMVGTPAYMSPEQVTGDAVDHRSDLWSLGVIAFECVTGRLPFRGRTLGELIVQICTAPLPRPSSAASVPAGFDDWFARAVDREVDGRFQSAAEMAAALRELMRGRGVTSGAEQTATAAPARAAHRHTGPSAPQVCRAVLCAAIDEPARLRQRLGRDYRAVVEQCRRVMRDALAPALSVDTDVETESTVASFASEGAALIAAIDVQRALAAHEWPKGELVRLRVALHAATPTGAARPTAADVQRAGRILDVAHGGQILLSDTLLAAIAPQMPAGVSLVDLGQHRLLEGDEATRLFQVGAPGLPSAFPPLRSAGPNNLPAEPTEFIGRVEELRRVRALLEQSRLVTLIGPGGEGKTRLALRAAHEMLAQFADGVFFVPLADIRQAALFGATVAGSLGLSESSERTASETLAEHLAGRAMLLVLDNLEQIEGVAPHIAQLLERAPRLHVLATSRIPVGLRQEQLLPLPPLATPAADVSDGPIDLDHLAAIDSIALFERRARAVDPGFTLSSDNAAAVAAIVMRLEGLPLAIELAAARVSLFSPDALARRLERGFDILRSTFHDLPARHRTLYDVVAWSYELLDEDARRMLRRLAIFAGSFSMESAEAVVGDPSMEEVVGLLGVLVDSSLLRRDATSVEPRFSMLESIREFAGRKLERSDEAEAIRRRHVAHFVALAEESGPVLHRGQRGVAHDRLLADEANLRAALQSCVASGDAESGLRLAGAVWRFWQSTGRLEEGRGWLTELLAAAGDGVPPAIRARGLTALAGLEYWQGRYAVALEHYGAARALYETVGDQLEVARTLFALSTTYSWMGETATGGRLADEALARFEALGAREEIGMVRMAQGFTRWMEGDLAGARPLWESSIEIAREVGDDVEAAHKRLALASITFQEGRPAQAVEEAFDALEELREHGNVSLTVMALEWIAALGAARAPERCARLAAAAAELRRPLGGGMRPEACGLRAPRDTVAELLDPATFELAWRDGSRMRLDAAVQFARSIRGELAGG